VGVFTDHVVLYKSYHHKLSHLNTFLMDIKMYGVEGKYKGFGYGILLL